MTPVLEIRGAIPYGLSFGLSTYEAFFYGFLGNIFITLILIQYLEVVSVFLRSRFSIFEKFFTWLFSRTRRKYSKKVVNLGEIFLFLFVAVPLPITGAWTAVAISFVFGFNRKKSFLAISLGVFVAGMVVLGVFNTLLV